jgi:hypothetical protein
MPHDQGVAVIPTLKTNAMSYRVIVMLNESEAFCFLSRKQIVRPTLGMHSDVVQGSNRIET